MLMILLFLLFAITVCLCMPIYIAIVKFVFNEIIIPSIKLTGIVCFSLFIFSVVGSTEQCLGL